MSAKTSDWRPGPTVCRCCLSEGCYKDISTEYFWMGKREVYVEMLTETFDLNIAFSQTTGPNSNSRLICESCISRLRDATEFKRQVKDCEKTFLNYLDPSSLNNTSIIDTDEQLTEIDKDVKLECVKEETLETEDDDDYMPPADMNDDDDDDDDDLDNQPLTKLASKMNKNDSLELSESEISSKKPSKRKSTIKLKETPPKKAKTKKDAKASASKAVIKLEKKKKDELYATMATKRNAELIVKYSTVYPFRIPQYCMVCVYCCESYTTPSEYREHMEKEHKTFKLRMAFLHCHEGFLKVDCSKIRCRICNADYKTNLDAIASHLYYDHKINLDLEFELGLQPFVLKDNVFACAICKKKTYNMRQLSRHTQSHFLKFTCESCGKSYATNTSLRNHMKYGHISSDKCICRKCKICFNSPEERRQHILDSSKCWSYLCNICGERCMTWEIKRLHLAEVHQIEEKPVKCPECDAVFPARKAFNAHFRIEHTDDNYICTFCGMKFASKKTLEEHRTIHTKEKRYECTVCSKLFPRKKNLVQHMWIHSEHKRFECTLCDRQFSQRVSWKGHMQSQHPDLFEIPFK